MATTAKQYKVLCDRLNDKYGKMRLKDDIVPESVFYPTTIADLVKNKNIEEYVKETETPPAPSPKGKQSPTPSTPDVPPAS